MLLLTHAACPSPPHLQAHFRVSRAAQHLIQADDAAAYYGPCDPPPAKCPRPRGFNLEADYFNITPYHRFKEFYRYKGEPRRAPGGRQAHAAPHPGRGHLGGGAAWQVLRAAVRCQQMR